MKFTSVNELLLTIESAQNSVNYQMPQCYTKSYVFFQSQSCVNPFNGGIGIDTYLPGQLPLIG